MTTTEKTCFKCGATKPLTEFYAHKRMADGHLNKCKCCTKQDVRQHRHGAGRDRVLAYDRERAKLPERIAQRNETNRLWREKHPDRSRAQTILARAVKSGKVERWPVCAVPHCNSTETVAHHPDYSRPLDVVWLCQAHHLQAHALVQQVSHQNNQTRTNAA